VGKAERFDRSRHPKVLEVLKLEVARIRDEFAPGRQSNQWQKVLGAIERKYGYRAGEIIPGAKALKPSTTITDTFTDTNGTSLDAHTPTPTDWGSWSEVQGDFDIQSNKAESIHAGTPRESARADSDLSTDDHYGQVVCTSKGNSIYRGVICRFAAAAEPYYSYTFRPNNTSNVHVLAKVVTGTSTNLDVQNDSSLSDVATTVYVEADGSTQEGRHNGTPKVTGTDTAIAGNLRCGLNGAQTANDQLERDDFEAADLIGSGALLMHHDQMTMGVGS